MDTINLLKQPAVNIQQPQERVKQDKPTERGPLDIDQIRNQLKSLKPEYRSSDTFAKTIFDNWKKLEKKPGNAYFYEASPTRGFHSVVTPTDFYICTRAAGAGAFSKVYFTCVIPKDGSPSTNKIIKISKKDFKQEVRKLDLLSPNSKTSLKIDHFVATYSLISDFPLQENQPKYIAIFNPSECDLSHVNYTKFKEGGAYYILKQLIDMLDGIASFHRQNLILGDIKGANLLCNPLNGEGKVTDFGLVIKLGTEEIKHHTAVTPRYAAPYIWDTILGQKYRRINKNPKVEGGFQGKASDVFSFGRTLQLDVINRILSQYGEKHKVSMAPFVGDSLVPRKRCGFYDDKDLLAFEKENCGRVFLIGADKNKGSVLEIFEKPEVVCQSTERAIQQLEGHISSREAGILKGLAHLAKELQSIKKEELLMFLGAESENDRDTLVMSVKKKLQELQERHAFPKRSLFSGESSASDAKKRKEGPPVTGKESKKPRVAEISEKHEENTL